MVFFEEWIYMKSTAMRQYFQYICKRYLFGGTPVWKWVVLMVDPPDSGIWMVCYQEW